MTLQAIKCSSQTCPINLPYLIHVVCILLLFDTRQSRPYKSGLLGAQDVECFMADHLRFISKYTAAECTVHSDKLFCWDLLSVRKSYVHATLYVSSRGDKAVYHL